MMASGPFEGDNEHAGRAIMMQHTGNLQRRHPRDRRLLLLDVLGDAALLAPGKISSIAPPA
jgi:hypothetical protein